MIDRLLVVLKSTVPLWGSSAVVSLKGHQAYRGKHVLACQSNGRKKSALLTPIESNVDTIVVNGSNSTSRFSANVTVDTCSIVGNDNTAERAENVTLGYLVQGAGNSGF